MDQHIRAETIPPILAWEREQQSGGIQTSRFSEEVLPEFLQYMEKSKPADSSTMTMFGRGFVHGALERPVNGLSELVNHTFGTRFPELSIVDSKGFDNSLAATLGTGAGSLVPLTLTYAIATPLIRGPVLRGAIAGGVYGGILTPSMKDGTNFFVERAVFATAGAAFGAAAGMTGEAFRGRIDPKDVPDTWGYYKKNLGPLLNPEQWR